MTELRNEIHGQLIPLEDDRLLLPNTAIVEVLGMDDIEVSTDGPSWLLGHLNWRMSRIPVISVEGLFGRVIPARIRRSRLVIINTFGRALEQGFFAVVSQGHPHLTTLNKVALQPDDLGDEPAADLLLAKLKIANTTALIPDLEAFEQRLAQVQNTQFESRDWAQDMNLGIEEEQDAGI